MLGRDPGSRSGAGSDGRVPCQAAGAGHAGMRAPARVPPYQSYPDGMSITALPPFRLSHFPPLGLGANNLPDYGEQSQLGANRHSGGGVLLVRHEYARRQNAGLPHSIRAARTAAGIPAYGHGMQSTMRWGVGAIRVPAPQERDRRPSWDLAGTHGGKDVVQRFSTPTRQKARPPSMRGNTPHASRLGRAGGRRSRPCTLWRSKSVPGRGRSGRLCTARGPWRAVEAGAVLLDSWRDGRIRPPYCSAPAPPNCGPRHCV